MAHLRDDGKVEVSCDFEAETPHAVLIFDHDTEQKTWLPFSHVFEMHRNVKDKGVIVISEWIARKKGLIDD